MADDSSEAASLGFCCYSNRRDDVIGIKLLLLSLKSFEPRVPVTLYVPSAFDAEALAAFATLHDRLAIREYDGHATGWNAKPNILLDQLLSFRRAVWLDADLMLTGPIRAFVAADDNICIAAEEVRWSRHQGSAARTSAWALQGGRVLGRTVNTCVVSVTAAHHDLLSAWKALLDQPAYLEAQRSDWFARPLHMLGDQDAFTALLGSADFRDVKYRLLKEGITVAHCFGADGFVVADRLHALFHGLPPLLHAQGEKPWATRSHRPLYLQVSPYALAARTYKAALPADEFSWTLDVSPAAKILSALSLNHPSLPGLPSALVKQVARRLAGLVGRGQRPLGAPGPAA